MPEYIVIGLGRFGASLATELQALGNEVVGVDLDRQTVQEMSALIREAIEADATSEATLRELGVTNVDAAIVAIGATEANIMITMLLKKLGVPYVIAKAGNDLHAEILRRVGADRVVFPEQETAVRLAHGIAVPEIFDYLSITRDMGIAKLHLPKHLVGRSYAEAEMEQRFEARLIAIIRRDRVLFGASVGEKLQPEDVLLLAGKDKDLRALGRLTQAPAPQQPANEP
jgi:trk system potassium uptake protein TrkA